MFLARIAKQIGTINVVRTFAPSFFRMTGLSAVERAEVRPLAELLTDIMLCNVSMLTHRYVGDLAPAISRERPCETSWTRDALSVLQSCSEDILSALEPPSSAVITGTLIESFVKVLSLNYF